MHSNRILLVGLGNHTHPYTRHSIGRIVLNHIATCLNLSWSHNDSWQGTTASAKLLVTDASLKRQQKGQPLPEITTTEVELTLLKPRLLMNICGPSVAKAAKGLSIPTSQIIVIHDDLELPLGKTSLKYRGSSSGHNGVKSVIASLHTHVFRRVRVGIGRPDRDDSDAVSNYVLGKITNREMNTIEKLVFPFVEGEALDNLCREAFEGHRVPVEKQKSKKDKKKKEKDLGGVSDGEKDEEGQKVGQQQAMDVAVGKAT
ncbi:hypothetical protein BC938DRAFT_471422 [Jimgerdemannia flammicorona]|uniref:peptidyl-tRNA hydrolase n=1 Tax=Jimgerdemannia flammicorona TaxID=994334 RepID=A0A433Q836_9FUNG|nr:hypothetical protein BC938DRAFT_471422 [Jimgerdemannia flammicorona]